MERILELDGVRIFLPVFCFALFLQFLPFLLDWVPPRALYGDEPGYWQLSQVGLWNFIRPPGYPLFLKLCGLLFGESQLGIYILQSFLTALRPLLILRLMKTLGVRTSVAVAFSLLSACSFTAIGLSKHILTDTLFSLAVLASLVLLIENRIKTASLVAGFGLLIKPINLCWIIFAPVALFAVGFRGKELIRHSAIAVAVPLLILSTFTVANYRRYGVATYSGISTLALVRYLGAAVIGTERVNENWDDKAIHQAQDELTTGAVAEVIQDDVTPANYASLKPLYRGILLKSPLRTMKTALHSMWLGLPRPFYWNELFLPGAPAASSTVWAIGKAATGCLWVLAILAIPLGITTQRLRAATLLGCFLACSFLLVCSISFWEGARLFFPMEWTLFFLASVSIEAILARRAGALITADSSLRAAQC